MMIQHLSPRTLPPTSSTATTQSINFPRVTSQACPPPLSYEYTQSYILPSYLPCQCTSCVSSMTSQQQQSRSLYMPPGIQNMKQQYKASTYQKRPFPQLKTQVKTSEAEPVVITRSPRVSTQPSTDLKPKDGDFTLATLFKNKIFVGSLTPTITAGDLLEHFQKFGTVTEAKIVIDNKGSSRGYGFVTFDDTYSVQKILMAGSIFVCNQRIVVASAIRKKHPDEM